MIFFLQLVLTRYVNRGLLLTKAARCRSNEGTEMITKTKQNWTPGATVKVGFLTLTVVRAIPTPGDFAPDEYILRNTKGQLYSFVPHHGLCRI
jgi:hypothetical protein